MPADGRLGEAHRPAHRGVRADGRVRAGRQARGRGRARRTAGRADLDGLLGTSVTAGRGTVVVTATGMRRPSSAGSPACSEARIRARRRCSSASMCWCTRLALAAGAIVAVVFVLGLLRGEEIDTLLLTAVSLAVAAIPESLPAVVTITLALGAQRMLRRHALIRRLFAVETLGSVTTICSDKTGTLTQNQMTVVVLDMAGDRRDLDDEQTGPRKRCAAADAASPAGRRGAVQRHAPWPRTARCSATRPRRRWSRCRSATAWTRTASRRSLPRVAELPFDSERKRMTTVHALPAHAERRPGAAARGLRVEERAAGRPDRWPSPRARSTACWRAATASASTARPWRSTTITAPACARGRRAPGRRRACACSAWRCGSGPTADAVPEDSALEAGLTLLGLVGMIDPARPEVRDAVAVCRDAGVRAVMITGDHPLTAAAIAPRSRARRRGCACRDGRRARAARRRPARSDGSRGRAVYARVSPQDKLRIVEALQRRAEVVAMTGDGVNDAPALKQADIGVAMGITGTDVTKDAGRHGAAGRQLRHDRRRRPRGPGRLRQHPQVHPQHPQRQRRRGRRHGPRRRCSACRSRCCRSRSSG